MLLQSAIFAALATAALALPNPIPAEKLPLDSDGDKGLDVSAGDDDRLHLDNDSQQGQHQYSKQYNTVTSTATSSVTTTTIDTLETTVTDIATLTAPAVYATVTSTTTATSTLYQTAVSKNRRDDELNRRGDPLQALAQLARAEVSKACSCLNIPTPTVTSVVKATSTVKAVATTTVTSTAITVVVVTKTSTYPTSIASTVVDVNTVTFTGTVTSTETDTITETLQTTVIPTSTVTVVTTAIATTTVTADPCDPSTAVYYNDVRNGQDSAFGSNGYGDGIITQDAEPEYCCRLCFNTPGCVAHQSSNYQCHFIYTNPVDVGKSAQCPNGIAVGLTATGRSQGLPPFGTSDFGLGPCYDGGVDN
ncbi:MAG: hypothetical protein M4579_004410 [Chaenotheca gracillima]|nr:MAG: hypothetical protein M4579_004410 [Chaenotheca gracillima]